MGVLDYTHDMIKCPTCGNEVAKSANACPHCGHNLYGERVNKRAGCCLVPLLVIVVLGILLIIIVFKTGI